MPTSFDQDLTAAPVCDCGGREFRAHMFIPATLHVSPTEETLEVFPVATDDIEELHVECVGCGEKTSVRPATDPLPDTCIGGAAHAAVDALGHAWVMTPLR